MSDGTRPTSSKVCQVDTCQEPALCRGWCSSHYARWRSTGDVQADKPITRRVRPYGNMQCSATGCSGPASSRGLCKTHYSRLRRKGAAQADIPVRQPVTWRGQTCQVSACMEPAAKRGDCIAHYVRRSKHGDPLAHIPIQARRHAGKICQIPECGLPVRKKVWCSVHYERIRRTGSSGSVETKRSFIPIGAICLADDCNNPVKAQGLCKTHYSRLLRKGDAQVDQPVLRSIAILGDPCHRPGCKEPVAMPRLGLCYRHYRKDWEWRLRKDPDRWEQRRRGQRESKKAGFARYPERKKKRAESVKAWMKAHPERARLITAASQRRRRLARKVKYTAAQLQAKIEYWGSRCWICRGPWNEIDHVKPIARGGWDILANTRPACSTCNLRKAAKWPFPTRRGMTAEERWAAQEAA